MYTCFLTLLFNSQEAFLQNKTSNQEKLKGSFHALIIGVSDYEDNNIPDLAGIPTDYAKKLSQLLVDQYNFEKNNVLLLINPKRDQIINGFNEITNNVAEEDSVLIFFAGHGIHKNEDYVSFWLPTDFNLRYDANGIYNSKIKSLIKSINSKHTLLISDQYIANTLKSFKTYNKPIKSIFQKHKLISRKVMIGGKYNEEVLDKVYDTTFLKYLLKRLNENQKKYLSASNLFMSLEDAVMNNSDNIPRYGPIFGTGDEGGDFIFVRINL